uniref:alkaline phosphatase n=1 Tax=Timema cristinae TaxID=61476 RepID=A0A7R9GZE0_TIMCR|nr:unnamed protein product [Timema cristinae]
MQLSRLSSDREFWYENARLELARRLDRPGTPPRHDRAKNVVVFVGDGLGLATLTAARILKGQKEGKTGEEGWLAWDLFPAVALAKVRLINYTGGHVA